jgi:DNA-binding winged helix-turn-helix (wHTH) protein
VHHETIVQALWGERAEDAGALHQLVHRLRQKVSSLPLELVAVPGVGFLLELRPGPQET